MTLEEKLADAQQQLHLLLTGQQAKVFVDSNGERVEYTSANRAELKKYVASLEAAVVAAAGTGSTMPSGPMRTFM